MLRIHHRGRPVDRTDPYPFVRPKHPDIQMPSECGGHFGHGLDGEIVQIFFRRVL